MFTSDDDFFEFVIPIARKFRFLHNSWVNNFENIFQRLWNQEHDDDSSMMSPGFEIIQIKSQNFDQTFWRLMQ